MWCWSPPRATTGSHMSCATGAGTLRRPTCDDRAMQLCPDNASQTEGSAVADVTIQISLGAGAAAVTSSGAVVASQGTTEAPPPMPLEQLQVGAAQSAPAPKSPEELSRIGTDREMRATS